MRLNTKNKIIFGVLGLTLLAIAFLWVRSNLIGAQIAATYPNDGEAVGALARIGIKFSQPMNTQEVEQRVKIVPESPGSFSWDGNTLWFTPQNAWRSDISYSMTLEPGASARDGLKVLRSHTLQFHVRQPKILFLSKQPDHLALYSVTVNGEKPQPLSAQNQDVYDFAPSRDGEQVAYSVIKPDQSIDLWLVQRDGTRSHRLVDCGTGQCSQPAWTPDGNHIVYYRQFPPQSNQTALTGVWSVNSLTGETDYLFPGSFPSVSPDGSQLALVDTIAGVVRILNIDTGKGVEFAGDTDILPAWFPDGSKVIYARSESDGEITYVALYQVDLKTHAVTPLLKNTPSDEILSMPEISPDAANILVGKRGFSGSPAEQLWVMDLNGGHAQKITDEARYSHTSYSWDPWGTQVLFQRLEMGVSSPNPEVMVWNRQSEKTRLIATQATLPTWFP